MKEDRPDISIQLFDLIQLMPRIPLFVIKARTLLLMERQNLLPEEIETLTKIQNARPQLATNYNYNNNNYRFKDIMPADVDPTEIISNRDIAVHKLTLEIALRDRQRVLFKTAASKDA